MTTTKSTTIIAEAGVNHDGSLTQAKLLVDAAVEAGADVVKFQTFRAERLVTKTAPKARYQRERDGDEQSHFEMIRNLELDVEAHLELADHCRDVGISMMSTPFDVESVKLLADTLNLPTLKCASGEITNGPLLLALARAGKPLIVSTGMSTMAEVERALAVLAFGYTAVGREPSTASFREAFVSDRGQRALRDHVQLLHCTTRYPCPPAEVNLRAMDTLRAAFALPVGYSDHTEGLGVPIAAAARGAVIIEKHFTLDRAAPGPDHAASIEPADLRTLVRAIREVDAALGDGVKRPTSGELDNLPVARRSLVAQGAIAQGDRFTAANLQIKRPGDALSPMRYWELLGRSASRSYGPDEPIDA